MSSFPFLTLPPELRHLVYEYYYTTADGYFLQPISRKLAAANGLPIDLALMYTCRLIAYETRDLPLSYNKVTVLRSTIQNFVLGLAALTMFSSPSFRNSAFLRQSNRFSALCEALEFTLRTLAQRPSEKFDRIVEYELLGWEHRSSDRLLNFLDQSFKPWDVPHPDVLAEMERRYSDDHLWSKLEAWGPDEHQKKEYLAKFRFSAASAAIDWLTKVPAKKRVCIRGLGIIEDYPSVGRQECHAAGLVPFCKENPQLRISHRVSMLNVIFSRALLRRATSFASLRAYARHEIGEVAFKEASSASFSEIANWLAETVSLPEAGMPNGAYTFTLDGEPIPVICSRIFQHIVLRKEAMRITMKQSLPSLDEGTRLDIAPRLHRGHGNAFAQLIDNTSFIKANFDPGQLEDPEKMLAEFQRIGAWRFLENYRGFQFDFELLRPPSVYNLPRLGALTMPGLQSIFVLGTLLVTSVNALSLPAGVPRDISEFRDKHPYTPPKHEHREIVRIRASKNDTDDVSDEFKMGVRKANGGGTLHLAKGKTYVIGKALDLTGLEDIHIHLEGEIRFTDDVEYWQENAWYHPFQQSIMFWKWGGKDIKIYGNGVIEGQGQRWWNEFESGTGSILNPDNKYYRPILFYAENTTNLDVSGIHLKDSPCWDNFIVSSKNIKYTDVVATALSNNGSIIPKNTDFMNTMNTSTVRIERTWVNIDDDCFSPKPNSSDLYVNTMYCNGTHGQSMGSLGQYKGEVSNVYDVHIENVWMMNGDYSAARIKVWAGEETGTGFVNNVTFKNFWVARMDYGIFLDSCYFNISSEECNAHPSGMQITNIHFENFTGYTSGVYGNDVARLSCSAAEDAVCANITVKDFNVRTPCGGEPVIICDGMHGKVYDSDGGD
ncbi:exopolygalacturonase B [Fusarium tjaetaba]|uniref:galacturonan 1,4-alpha-galacturonidase n=1 Tax=Fusarium tjaetaba TaxID=1567544 RepID=A0A8H5VSI3_9HYPO|nr:exopolygalacturonase B [Fusarium tjaetaba]KAF5633991.1 exopolygalacturonase B [Fusarium tjaetaba]